jgi:hypothetical protein
MKHLGKRWLQIMYVFAYVILWAALAIVPIAGLLGAFNPSRYYSPVGN